MWLSLLVLIPLLLLVISFWNSKRQHEKALNDLWSALVLMDVASSSYFTRRWENILEIYEASDIEHKDKLYLKEAIGILITFRDNESRFADRYNIKAPRYNKDFGIKWDAAQELGVLANTSTSDIFDRAAILRKHGYRDSLLKNRKVRN